MSDSKSYLENLRNEYMAAAITTVDQVKDFIGCLSCCLSLTNLAA